MIVPGALLLGTLMRGESILLIYTPFTFIFDSIIIFPFLFLLGGKRKRLVVMPTVDTIIPSIITILFEIKIIRTY